MATNANNGSGLGALLTGVSIFAFSTYWPDLFGVTPGTYDFMVSGFGQVIGGTAAFHGAVTLSRTAQAKEQRKALEQTTGTFGTADFASEEEIAAKRLRDPNGLYMGLHQGQPIFYSGDGHLFSVTPARTGKGTTTATPNCLHNTGSMLITDPKGELAAMSGEHREARFGQNVYYWNPYGLLVISVTGGPRASLSTSKPVTAKPKALSLSAAAGRLAKDSGTSPADYLSLFPGALLRPAGCSNAPRRKAGSAHDPLAKRPPETRTR